MFSLVYDEDIAKAVAREEGWEDGLEQGQTQLIERMLLKGRLAEDIADATDMPLERVIYIKERLADCLTEQ